MTNNKLNWKKWLNGEIVIPEDTTDIIKYGTALMVALLAKYGYADGANQWGNVQFDGSTAVVSFYKTSDANWTLGANRAVTANINYLIAN